MRSCRTSNRLPLGRPPTHRRSPIAAADDLTAALAVLPLLLREDEAARLLRIGRTLAYQLTREYEATEGAAGLPTVRVGRKLRVPRWALARYLARTGGLDEPVVRSGAA